MAVTSQTSWHRLLLLLVQIAKILITPVVVLIEYVAYGKTVSRQKMLAIVVLMFGITIATVSDSQVSSNPLGILVAIVAVLSSALYQVRGRCVHL